MTEGMNFGLTGTDGLSPVFDDAGDAAVRMARRIDRAAADARLALHGLQRDADGRLRELNGRFASASRLAQLGLGDGISRGAVKGGSAMTSLIAAGAPLVGMLASAGVAAVAFGAVAAPSVMKVVKASADLTSEWSSLSKQQKISALQVSALKDEYKALAKSYEPQTLRVFNGVVSTARGLLPQLGAVFGKTSGDVALFADRIESFISGRVGGEFFTWAGQRAPEALDALGTTMTTTGDTVLDLVQDIEPLAVNVLQLTNGVLSAVNALAGFNPMLAQFALSAIALRAPIAGIIGGLTSFTGRMRTAAAATAGMTVRARALSLVTAAGPNLWLAGAVALGAWALSAKAARSSADELVDALEVQYGAVGNNVAGYRQLATEMSGRLIKAQNDLTKAKDTGSEATKKELVAYFDAEQRVTAYSSSLKSATAAASAIDKGSRQLATTYDLTTDQAIRLATAAGVNLATSVDKSGNLTAGAAAKVQQYTLAVQAANDPTKQVGIALEAAGNSALNMTDRVKGLQAAMDAFFNPSIAVYNATTSLKKSLDDLGEAFKKSKGEIDGSSAAALASQSAFSQVLQNTRDLNLAIFQKTHNQNKANAASQAQLPVLYALAGGNKNARAQVDALAKSLGATAGVTIPARREFLRAAAAMGITGKQASDLFRHLDQRPKLKLDITDLTTKLNAAQAQLKTVPANKQAKLLGDISDLKKKIAAARAEMARIHDKTVTVSVRTTSASRVAQEYGMPKGATGGLYTGRSFRTGYSGGGLVGGPGTGTSDSVFAPWLSKGEYVVRANAVRYFGVNLLDSINRLKIKKSVLSGLGGDTGRGFIANMTGTADDIKSWAKKLSDAIKAAFKGKDTRIDDRILASIAKGNARLQKLAKDREKIAAKIAEAKEFAAGITSSARQGALLSTISSPDDKPITTMTLAMGLSDRLTRIRSFMTAMRSLQKRGLNPSLLRQVFEMGPEQGLPYAQALLAAGDGTFRQMNSFQKEIDKETTALGKYAANVLYDKGGKGFLANLTADKKGIDALMLAIAKAMQASIRKSLGLPPAGAKVGARLGDDVVATTHNGKKIEEDVVAVTHNRSARVAAVGTGRSGTSQGVVINVYADATTDPMKVTKAIHKSLLTLKRNKGGAALGLA